MEAIEKLLRECGETVLYALDERGHRVTGGNAHRAAGISAHYAASPGVLDAGYMRGQLRPLLDGSAPTVYAVECDGQALCACIACGDMPDPAHSGLGLNDQGQPGGLGGCGDAHLFPRVVRVDHHRPGDPGFGREPRDFLAASSIGQVAAALAQLGLLPAGWRWDDSVIVVPVDVVITAAADHCLGSAYRGECPGVDPDELLRWRVASRARFQGRNADAILADVETARQALLMADDIPLDRGPRVLGRCSGCGIKCEATEDDPCWDYCECPMARDMRGTHVPELVEAGTRYGIAYVARGLPDRDGRTKVVCSGESHVIEAFLGGWAASQGLVDAYGDPARGFAGAYERALDVTSSG
jgi:hypothetical protein